MHKQWYQRRVSVPIPLPVQSRALSSALTQVGLTLCVSVKTAFDSE
uniref:Uncharacterized protein n=1 Tax=Anguilla anguilla TaxID=7936 RepID=A0A0E9VQF8_ANGAN